MLKNHVYAPRAEVTDSRYKNPDNDPRGPYVLSNVTSPFVRSRLIYEWRGRLPPAGRSWRYDIERASELEAQGRIVFSKSGVPSLKRYLNEINQPELPLPRDTSLTRLDLILRPAMQKIAEIVANDPAALQHLEWRDLERMLREVFEKLGYDTLLTRSTKDGGFDLRLECDSEAGIVVFLVEVKHWINSNKRPGSKEISALFDVVVRSAEEPTGILLSSTGFTKNAVYGRTEVEQQTVRLGGENKIVSLCQDYLRSTSGIWRPTTDLARLLRDGTS